MRVQAETEPTGELGRLTHQLLRDRERRARRHHDLDAGARAVLVQACRGLGLGERAVGGLDYVVRRKPAAGLPEVHRAA
jgi:hypothetical protein